MKEQVLSLCRKIYLAVKEFNSEADGDDDYYEYEGITIMRDSPIDVGITALKGKLRDEFPRIHSMDVRVSLLYTVLNNLPLMCDDCQHVQTKMKSTSEETVTRCVEGYVHTSVWSHLDEDEPKHHDEVLDEDTLGDGDVDSFSVSCNDCGSRYDSDMWTIAVPRDLADLIFEAAKVISGKKSSTPALKAPKTPAIFNQFSEVKNRPQLEISAFDEGGDGVGYPLEASMEKLLG
jgi:hypothetical protein